MNTVHGQSQDEVGNTKKARFCGHTEFVEEFHAHFCFSSLCDPSAVSFFGLKFGDNEMVCTALCDHNILLV